MIDKPKLTAVETNLIGAAAHFIFDVDLKDGSDTYIVTGDGTDDLDRLLAIFQNNPHATVRADVNPQDTSFKEVSALDVQAIRASFLTFYTGTSQGTLAKPDAYILPIGAAASLNSPGVGP